MNTERVDIRAEQRKIGSAALASLVLCTLSFAAGWYLLPRYFEFPASMLDRIVFTLRAEIFVWIWVLFGVGLVSRARRYSEPDIQAALSGPPSPRIAVKVAFLQNTLEQAALATGAHLTLATLLTGDDLALIVVAIVLFALGRITFLMGYRKGAGGRAFGMVTTALPTFAGYALALWLMAFRA